MKLSDNIDLASYSDSASKAFNDMEKNLSEVEKNVEMRMGEKSRGDYIRSFVVTFVWFAVFAYCAIKIKDMVPLNLLLFTIVIILGLLIFMQIDHVICIFYYNKISAYKAAVMRLKDRVRLGRNSINSNLDAFKNAKEKGEDMPLTAGASILGEMTAIAAAMTRMESLKNGAINSIKNYLFFASVVMATITVLLALFPFSKNIIVQMCGESPDSDLMRTLNIVATIIVIIVEVILGKFLWSETNCMVTNVTLLVIPVAPFAFIILFVVGTILVMLIGTLLMAAVMIAAGIMFISSVAGG